jgi:hypothetical protein
MNSMMTATEKPFHCNQMKHVTCVEGIIAFSISLVVAQPQLVWLQQFVSIHMLMIVYGLLWTFVPVTIHVHSWKKISFSKPW